jgi:hypothetical protein
VENKKETKHQDKKTLKVANLNTSTTTKEDSCPKLPQKMKLGITTTT